MLEKYTELERLEYARARKPEFPEHVIHPSAVIDPSAQIGQDGFGWVRDEVGQLVKMPHCGNVVIEANVSIGACTCIDRAVNGSTVIGEGVKVDNLCHLGHGCIIGKHTLIVAGSIIGGSVVIGERCYIGMGAKIKNKVKIGNNVLIGAGAVVLKDVPDDEVWVGNPAKFLRKNEGWK